jgi:hypothetical protein
MRKKKNERKKEVLILFLCVQIGSAGKNTVTLSHEIVELLLQLCVLVIDAPHDGMLEGTAQSRRQPPHRSSRAFFPLEVRWVGLTFPGGSGTARKIWRGCRSPISSPDSSQIARTTQKK